MSTQPLAWCQKSLIMTGSIIRGCKLHFVPSERHGCDDFYSSLLEQLPCTLAIHTWQRVHSRSFVSRLNYSRREQGTPIVLNMDWYILSLLADVVIDERP